MSFGDGGGSSHLPGCTSLIIQFEFVCSSLSRRKYAALLELTSSYIPLGEVL